MRTERPQASERTSLDRADRSAQKRFVTVCSLVALLTIGSALAAAQTPSEPSVRAPVSASQIDGATRKEVVDTLAEKLANEYAHAEPGQKMAQAIREKLAARGYDTITSSDEFARALQADIRAIVNDKHLRVSFDARPMRGPPSGSMPGPMPVPGQGAVPGGPPPDMIAAMRKANGEIRRVEVLPGNVGYMEVNGVPPMSNEAIDAAFALLRNTDALIIDLRGNGGGDPETVAYYMSYLSEGKSYVVMRVQTRREGVQETHTTDLGNATFGAKKPVYVLTSYMTFSGGEEFAYDVQAFKRGTVVGEVTGGGANPGAMEPLGHGFIVFLPFGFGVHPLTGTNWEGVGVRPDVNVPASVALVEAHRLAVERLRVNTADPRERESLAALDLKLAGEVKTTSNPATQRLSKVEIQFAGSYAPLGGGGPGCSIYEKDGYLFLQPAGSKPHSRLVRVNGNSYHLDGLPEGFTATFSSHQDGKFRLLLNQGNWPPPPVMEKR